ncbi:MAG: DNA mismatch repair protein MutS [Candidatus Gastranaerophilales bacterium]|nr:DNA mismatch repair protein MutS [Candidatus Gastranaerophilales bacterium]
MLLDSNNFDRAFLADNKYLKNYFTIKDKHNDCIVLFQLGTFLEAYFQDAKILSKLSGMTLTSRNLCKSTKEIALCGFHIKHQTAYIKLLLDNNYKVCVCEEHKDENNEITRKVKRTYTQGTIIENEFLESAENNYIAAICALNNQMSFSYADVSTGQFYKTNGSFEEIKLEIEKIEPNEILIIKNQKDLFQELIKKYNITLLEETFYSKKSEEIIEKYCEYTQKSYCAKLSKIIEYDVKNYLIMDETTRKNLELTRTKMFLKKKGSLLWFLKNTKTPMGARLLKKYLSEPLLSIEKIKERQNAVEQLIKNKKLLKKIETTLEDFCDLSRICTKISNSTILPKDLYRISQNSSSLKELDKLSKKVDLNYLSINSKKLAFMMDLTEEIKKSIEKEAPDEITKGKIIKTGYNAALDYLKNNLKDFKKKLNQYENREKERLEINNLKISYSKVIGYYIEIPNSKVQKVSNEYFKKQGLQNCSRFGTEKLSVLEQEIFNLEYKINELEYSIYCDIRNKAKNFVEAIRELALEIAKIDIIASFAKCAIVNNFVKPNFNTKEIKIINGYHPSLIKLKNEIIKNDTEIKNGSMMILMGANMSGKSTYLKHNAIICLLAQIGSYIPADYADLVLIDKLFLRQGATDDIINNNSSFMVEMNDFKFIIDNITDSSFVLLDEPAKSTNEKEGGAIAKAFCEYLIEHYNSKIIIATHNFELTKLENEYPKRVCNFVIGDSLEGFSLSDRKIKKGTIKTSFAINTANLAGLPEEIINKAKQYIII